MSKDKITVDILGKCIAELENGMQEIEGYLETIPPAFDDHADKIDDHSKSIDALTARVADLSRQCQALAGIMESASHRISKLERPRPWWRRLATLWPFSTER